MLSHFVSNAQFVQILVLALKGLPTVRQAALALRTSVAQCTIVEPLIVQNVEFFNFCKLLIWVRCRIHFHLYFLRYVSIHIINLLIPLICHRLCF